MAPSHVPSRSGSVVVVTRPSGVRVVVTAWGAPASASPSAAAATPGGDAPVTVAAASPATSSTPSTEKSASEVEPR